VVGPAAEVVTTNSKGGAITLERKRDGGCHRKEQVPEPSKKGKGDWGEKKKTFPYRTGMVRHEGKFFSSVRNNSSKGGARWV